MVRLGAHGWELHPGSRCGGCEPYPGLRDGVFARVFVQGFANDALAMGAIREVLREALPPWTMIRLFSDDAVELLGDLLERGVWHVHAPAPPKDNGGGKSETEELDIAEMVPAAAPAASGAAPRPAPPPEDGSLPRNADEAAIAASMKTAAALGIPFCEECAKAALQRGAA
ncbi:hypothetical protein DYQ86_11575 [Acidobacteria bacterium AB60]|nr:hypothetical protein DYQ86_11575 [Acidobacteria bacterium AB60]